MRRQEPILLVGTGKMGKEYARVLQALHVPVVVVGRSSAGSTEFMRQTGISAESGGIAHWLKTNRPPRRAIVAVSVSELGNTARLLLSRGVKSMLLEKPAGLTRTDMQKTLALSHRQKANVYVAYNRRFYASVKKTQGLIKKDGGVKAVFFNFSERKNILNLPRPETVKRAWLLANSSHVIDLAFFLAGEPVMLVAQSTTSSAWKPTNSQFAGGGITKKGALISYQADWNILNNWRIEIMTPKQTLIFEPLEKLSAQEHGKTRTKPIPLDDDFDLRFKPGLYKEVRVFLENKKGILPTLADHLHHLRFYEIINKGGSF